MNVNVNVLMIVTYKKVEQNNLGSEGTEEEDKNPNEVRMQKWSREHGLHGRFDHLKTSQSSLRVSDSQVAFDAFIGLFDSSTRKARFGDWPFISNMGH